MNEFLFLSMFAVLVLVLIFALICSAINNISAFWARTKEARKRKREQNEFQKAKAEITKQKDLIAKQSVSKFIYGSSYGYLYTGIIAMHLFANKNNYVLRYDGQPFDIPQNLKLMLSAVHPNSRFPSNGYPLCIETCIYDEITTQFKAWFAPCDNIIGGFVVQKVNKDNIILLHGRFGTLNLPISHRRVLHKGDVVKVKQSSYKTDSGYLVSYDIV